MKLSHKMVNRTIRIKDNNKELEKYKKHFSSEIVLKEFENLKMVESEEEFWEKHKLYNDEIKKLSKNFKLAIYHPDEFIEAYENILIKMAITGVRSLEDINEERKKIYDELSKPHKMEEWLNNKAIVKRIKKIKNKLNKNKENKEK